MKNRLMQLMLVIPLICLTPAAASACEGKCDPANCAHHKARMGQINSEASLHAEAKTAMDPVCGMMIDQAEAAEQVEYEGKAYYFCMEGEKEAFLKDPGKYLGEN